MIHSFSRLFTFKGKDIPFKYYTNCPPAEVTTVVLLGTVQIGRLPQIVAKQLPYGCAVIQGAPHWLASPNGNDIPQFMFLYTKQSIATVLEGIHHNNRITLVADSQAAPGAIRYALQHIENIKELILLQPLGLNASAYTQSPLSAYNEFNRRLKDNFIKQVKWIITDPILLYNHFLILYRGTQNTLRQISNKDQYTAGLAYDSTDELSGLAKHVPIRIISGEHDALFPSKEIQRTIKKSAINIHSSIIIPNIPHSPLATRAGKQLLRAIYQ